MADPLQSGDVAPAFELPGDSGRTITLSSFAGRKLVLYFYPKDDTSGCTREALDFNALKTAFDAAGTSIVGVSPDSPKSHDNFRTKHKFDLALASDEKKEVCEAYGVWVEKSMYGRKYMGVERTTFLIDGAGRIVKIWSKVKVPDHAEQVLTSAKAI